MMILTLLRLATIACTSLMVAAVTKPIEDDSLRGAWTNETGGQQQVLLFVDNYFTHTGYSLVEKKFMFTHGGPYTIEANHLGIQLEFNTQNKESVGDSLKHSVTITGKKLVLQHGSEKTTFRKVDNGDENLAGLWKITARKQGNNLEPIHRSGTRKTIKILSGSRFQWAAINPGTKEFSGTGGGSYTFKNGKYTEHIEFFSRDSSRVGASLSFDGKLQDGDWHHSGLSSKGDPIYEVWSRR